VTPGPHRVLRFDFSSYNAGDADLVIGSPTARPELFVWSSGHDHYHLRDFNEFILFDANGTQATVGYKQAFCLIDVQRISPSAREEPRYRDCNSNQGISAGWADVYGAYLECQFIVLDDLPDGDYTLQSTTNARHAVGEDCFGDNTAWTGLRISRDLTRRALDRMRLFHAPGGSETVEVIDPPFVPEDRIRFNRDNVAAVQVGDRWKVVEGEHHWMLDSGTSQEEAMRAVEIINFYGLSFECFVGRPQCGGVDPMPYWLNEEGDAPGAHMMGEDCLRFDPANLSAVEVDGRWGLFDGSHWLHNFGPGEGNAIAAVHFIRKYGFNHICYVGRPDASMTYFRRWPRGR
jgi:hypothetical protein